MEYVGCGSVSIFSIPCLWGYTLSLSGLRLWYRLKYLPLTFAAGYTYFDTRRYKKGLKIVTAKKPALSTSYLQKEIGALESLAHIDIV